MVARVKDDRVTIITDSETKEITVFSRDLTEAADLGVAKVNAQYDLFDLVQLE